MKTETATVDGVERPRPAVRRGVIRGAALATTLVIAGLVTGFLPAGTTSGLATENHEVSGPALIQTAQRPGMIPALPTTPVPAATIRLPDSVDYLSEHFERVNYDLQAVQSGESAVPRVFTEALPSDLAEIDRVEERKDLFLRIVLPLALEVNESVLETRARLAMLKAELERGHPLDRADAAWLNDVAADYGVEDPRDFEALLLRVDAAPVSLTLVQAVQESGWGTSRFARDGNALFGQRTWSNAAPGFEPAALSDADFRVRAFGNLAGTVRAYVHNLNTSSVYEDFRQRRAAMRAAGDEVLDGFTLAETLQAYSEEGALYIEKLQALMEQNALQSFDSAQLRAEGLPQILVPDETIGHTQLASRRD